MEVHCCRVPVEGVCRVGVREQLEKESRQLRDIANFEFMPVVANLRQKALEYV